MLVHGADRGQLADVDEQGQDEGSCFTGTCDGDTDEIATLQGDRDGSALNGGGFSVAHTLYDSHDAVRQTRLVPVAHGVGDGAALGGNVEVFLEDAPVALAHVL